MSLVKRNNLILPSLMNEFLKPDWFGGMENRHTAVPSVNILDNEKEFELHFAVPGFGKEAFNLELDNDLLTVSGTVDQKEGSAIGNFSRREFSTTSFTRKFTLPETIETASINAVYENGILKVRLPKKEEALPKPKRLIEIA